MHNFHQHFRVAPMSPGRKKRRAVSVSAPAPQRTLSKRYLEEIFSIENIGPLAAVARHKFHQSSGGYVREGFGSRPMASDYPLQLR